MIYKVILDQLKLYPIKFLISSFAPCAQVLHSFFLPYGIKTIIDKSILYENHNNLLLGFFIIIFSWIIFMVMGRIKSVIDASLIPDIQHNLRMYCMRRILSYPYSFFHENSNTIGDLSSRIIELPFLFESARSILFILILPSIFSIILSLFIIYNISILIFIIFLFWVFVHLFTSLYCIKYLRDSTNKNVKKRNYISSTIIDILNNIKFIKINFSNEYELNFFEKKQDEESETQKNLLKKINKVKIFKDISAIIMFFFIILKLYFGVKHNMLSTGNMVMIISIIISVVDRVWIIGNHIATMAVDISAIKYTLNKIFCYKYAPHKKMSFLPKNGNISFENVSLELNKKKLSDCLNFNINFNEKVGIVGESGSGKSSVANLIVGLFDPDLGAVKIDNVNIKNIEESVLSNIICYIPQDSYVFNRLIIENIDYGNDKNLYINKKIIKSCLKSCCYSFINDRKKKFFDKMGEKGCNFSGGQLQRISLARLFLKDSKIFLFDEICSSLDILNKNIIYENIFQHTKNKTSIFITHDSTLAEKMDRIIFIRNGKIIAEGKHKELLMKNIFYKKIFLD